MNSETVLLKGKDTITDLDSENDLGQMIEMSRKSLHMSQRDFAKIINITQAQLCRLEKGLSKKPNKKTLRALAPLMQGTTYAQLLAYAGYSADESEEAKQLEMGDEERLDFQTKGLAPDIMQVMNEIIENLNDPLNVILITKIGKLMKELSKEEGKYEDRLKLITLRDCIINMVT